MAQAVRKLIRARVICQHEVDPAKVKALVQFLSIPGSVVPPVVVAVYDDAVLPLDGHHRLLANQVLGRDTDAWVVSGEVFDELCALHRNAEAFVDCGGVPAPLLLNSGLIRTRAIASRFRGGGAQS